MTTKLTITRPDDWHLHLRDGDMLAAAVPFTARQFARAIVMPNLTPPVTTADQADAYKARIMDALPDGMDFTPLMTAYLTDDTDPDALAEGFERGSFTAAKLYPANATTNSAFGVSDITKVYHVVARMAEIGMPLLIHGEVTSSDIDIFDREAVFIETKLKPLMEQHPDARVVLEHITTSQSADFVKSAGDKVGATITTHHLVINRSDLFKGGIRPHLYCLPIAKREQHRLAVREAATSGDPSFFLGTDSAPHPVGAKESSCGCAGIFNAPTAMQTYAQVFEEEGVLDRLEAFASLNGPRFYGLPVNEGTITLEKVSEDIPHLIDVDDGSTVHLFYGGESIPWRVAG